MYVLCNAAQAAQERDQTTVQGVGGRGGVGCHGHRCYGTGDGVECRLMQVEL